MISSLAPLGVTHAMQLALLYDGKGNVVVTALLRPKLTKKDDDDDDAVDLSGLRTVQVSGTIEEVQKELAEHLSAAVKKIVKHTTDLAELDTQLAAELEAKKTEGTKAKVSAETKATAKASKKAEKKAAATVPADDDAEPPGDAEPTATPAAPTIAGLQPAWKNLKAPAQEEPKNPAAETATAPEGLGDLFSE